MKAGARVRLAEGAPIIRGEALSFVTASAAAAAISSREEPQELGRGIRASIGSTMWKWFDANADVTVLEVRVFLFLAVSLQVGELEPLWRALFGERPAAAGGDS